jgi:hypothetical protein
VVGGAYAVVLGLASPLSAEVVNGQDLYLGLSLNGGAELQPRVRVASVPYALAAADAHTLQGHAATDFALTAHSHANATTGAAGFMSATDKSKLDALDTGKPYAPLSHPHDSASCSSGAASASQCTVGFMPAADKFKLDKYPALPPSTATTSVDGLMSAADKTKLDRYAAQPPTKATASADGLMPREDKAKLDSYPAQPPAAATASTDGLMPKADKAKLDNLALTCSYRVAEAAANSSATAKCASSERLVGSTCAILDNGTLLSGAEPVNVTSVTANPSSTGPGVECAGNGDPSPTTKVHAWVYCCSL